jgi:hypothetical protein
MTAEKAEAMERSGLWHRAARCWLDVLDSSTDDAELERVVLRREHCIAMTNGITPDQRRYHNKQRYREQKSVAGY